MSTPLTKVFCIGFHKTGTTSLDKALTILGYRVMGCFGIHDTDLAETVLGRCIEYGHQFDAFQDNPWPILFKELDAKFPGSKFILTRRPVEKWLASIVNHASSEPSEMRRWIYGVPSPLGHEEIYRERYLRHYNEVEVHFQNRQDDILELDLPGGEGWEKLCPFLGHPIPDVPFPHANQASKGPWSTLFKRIAGHGPLRLGVRRVRRFFQRTHKAS